MKESEYRDLFPGDESLQAPGKFVKCETMAGHVHRSALEAGCVEAKRKTPKDIGSGQGWSELIVCLPCCQEFPGEPYGAELYNYVNLRRPFVLNLTALFEELQDNPELMEKVGAYLEPTKESE